MLKILLNQNCLKNCACQAFLSSFQTSINTIKQLLTKQELGSFSNAVVNFHLLLLATLCHSYP